MNVKGNHPLSEIIAKKLFGIEAVPPQEAAKMVSRACRAAVEWHEVQIEQTKKACAEAAGKAMMESGAHWSTIEAAIMGVDI